MNMFNVNINLTPLLRLKGGAKGQKRVADLSPEELVQRRVMEKLNKQKQRARARNITLEQYQANLNNQQAPIVPELAQPAVKNRLTNSMNNQAQKETFKWNKEIKQEENRQAKLSLLKLRKNLPIKPKKNPKWKKGEKFITNEKFVTVRSKLENKLWLAFNDNEKRLIKMLNNLEATRTSHAINRRVQTWMFPGREVVDPEFYLENTTIPVTRCVIESSDKPKKISSCILVLFSRYNSDTKKVEKIASHFQSGTFSTITPEDVTDSYELMKKKMLESMAAHQAKGSGWAISYVSRLDVSATIYNPIKGGTHTPLPKEILKRKAIINMKNKNDDKCFLWAFTRAKNMLSRDGERVTKMLKIQSEKYNWEGLKFPVSIKDIGKFELHNNTPINVFGVEKVDKKHVVVPLRITKLKEKDISPVNLFLYNKHYGVVSSLSRLISSQGSNHQHKSHVCEYCCNSFSTDKILQSHLEICSTHKEQKAVYPDDNNNSVSFKNFEKTTDVPFDITADFESFLLPVDTGEQKSDDVSHTTAYQKHLPNSFSYTVKCVEESIYPTKIVQYTAKSRDDNIGEIFMKSLEFELPKIHEIMKTQKVSIPLTEEEEKSFKHQMKCTCCDENLGEDRIIQYNKLTGKYCGVAHKCCSKAENSNPNFVPVSLHNLEGYDSHLFVKNMGITEGNIECIAKTDEKYISFSKTFKMKEMVNEKGKKYCEILKLRFIDTYKFMAAPLASLVKNLQPDQFKNTENAFSEYLPDQIKLLKKKGVYPYEFMDDFDKLSCTELPPQEKFYSKLNDSHITQGDYKHAKKVWREFGCKTMKDYHQLYLKLDVVLLADVMDSFRKVCKKVYGLDPLWYYTAPGLAWDAALKLTGQTLELITDPDMYLMIEKGIRGGISTITKRYAEANNKYMPGFKVNELSVFLAYLDANNLYGWAMCKKLPVRGFKWVKEDQLQNWKNIPCILEVDLEYPQELQDLHNEYPLAAESLNVNGVNKLIPNLQNKEKYVIHHSALKQCLELGLKLTKIHRGVTFEEKAWLKPYIELNTELRTQATSDFEKDFFKLMNNSVFGKTMENVRNRVDVRLVTTEEQLGKLARKYNYERPVIFDKNLVAVHMKKTVVKLNKPIYLGMSILDISKTLMYDFHYNYIKKKYGGKASLLFTDTDSLCYEIQTEDFYKDISGDVHTHFDTSNFEPNHISGIPCGINKKVLGMFKSETGSKQMGGFVGLRSKLYAYKMVAEQPTAEQLAEGVTPEGVEEKKCKGVKTAVKNKIKFQEYVDCLFSGKKVMKGMNTFRSRQHEIYTEHINKIALSADDDKRIICENKIDTLAIGHRLTERKEVNKGFTLIK